MFLPIKKKIKLKIALYKSPIDPHIETVENCFAPRGIFSKKLYRTSLGSSEILISVH